MTLLARNPRPQDEQIDLDYLVRSLSIPPRPAELNAAEEAWRLAGENLQAAQTRHVEAGRQLAMQSFGQVPTITRAEVDEIGGEIGPLVAAEIEAKAERDRQRAEYKSSASDQLEVPLQRYEEAIARQITFLEDLLSIGCLLNSEAVSARAKLSNKIISISPSILAHLQGMRVMMRRIRG